MITTQVAGLDDVVRNLSVKYPALAERARKSALSSTGFMIRTELRNHVEYGGTGWPSLHPLSKSRRKDKAGMWKTASKRSPLDWLGKYARYIMAPDKESVTIDFGRSRKGQAGSVDKYLSAIARKHERGAKVKVTPAMRRKMAMTAMGRKGKRRGEPGAGYFPLKAMTKYLTIPKRPSIGPVFRKIKPKVAGYMRDKFWAAFNRYQTGVAKV
ncbi:MAG: hypothetical protein AB7E32_16025 [Desulfovibrio sp.]